MVATDVGGTSELIHHGVHGLIVPPGDPDALASGIGDVLQRPAKTAARVAAGRARVEGELSFDVRNDSVQSIYRQLAENRVHCL